MSAYNNQRKIFVLGDVSVNYIRSYFDLDLIAEDVSMSMNEVKTENKNSFSKSVDMSSFDVLGVLIYRDISGNNVTQVRIESLDKARKRTPESFVSFTELEDVLPDNSIMPEIENAEIGKLISEFLKHEKPESRAVFIRKYWFFDSVSDIAARYSFTESKVKNMLYHSRNKLREFLKKEGIEV